MGSWFRRQPFLLWCSDSGRLWVWIRRKILRPSGPKTAWTAAWAPTVPTAKWRQATSPNKTFKSFNWKLIQKCWEFRETASEAKNLTGPEFEGKFRFELGLLWVRDFWQIYDFLTLFWRCWKTGLRIMVPDLSWVSIFLGVIWMIWQMTWWSRGSCYELFCW